MRFLPAPPINQLRERNVIKQNKKEKTKRRRKLSNASRRNNR